MTAHSQPAGYENKFLGFVKMIHDAKKAGDRMIVIDQPWAIGDNYEEIIESLSCIADAGLTLAIVRRAE